jgi:hypothetical protein
MSDSKPKQPKWVVYGAVFVGCGLVFLCVMDPPKPPPSQPPREDAPNLATLPAQTPSEPPMPREAPAPTAAAERPPTKADGIALLGDLRAILKVGEEMARSRYGGDPSEASQAQLVGQRHCVELMNANRPKLSDLSARATRMPESVDALKRLAGTLPGCIYCRPTADEGCNAAREALHDAERELRTAKW